MRHSGDAELDVQSGSRVFAADWLVLEHAGGELPDIRAAAPVAKALRATVMSGYRRAGLGHAIPAVVSGHSPDGRPTGEPHLSIVPLGFVSTLYAGRAACGFALIPPMGSGLFIDADFRNAICAVSSVDEVTGRRALRVHGSGINLTLTFSSGMERRSLDSAPYLRQARVWASCTPIILDRHVKTASNQARQREISSLIRRACINAGLPEPIAISAGKHSAIEGAPVAYSSAGEPRWTRWRVPESLASRQLIHAIFQFGDALRGPVILGAGRFVGLGLCCGIDGSLGSAKLLTATSSTASVADVPKYSISPAQIKPGDRPD